MKAAACAPAFTPLRRHRAQGIGQRVILDCGSGKAWSIAPRAWSMRRDGIRGQRSEGRWFKVLNIEQQSKKPQNDEVTTSIFEIPCSIFCGSKRS